MPVGGEKGKEIEEEAFGDRESGRRPMKFRPASYRELDCLLEEEAEVSHKLSRGDPGVGGPPAPGWIPYAVRAVRRRPPPRRFERDWGAAERKSLICYLLLAGVLLAWWALVNPKVPIVPSVVYTLV